MQYDLEPGNFVINPSQKSWGIGQVQSIIRNKATINFQNVGKQVINLDNIDLKDISDFENKIIDRCKSEKPQIIESILSSGKLEEQTEKDLIEVITNLKETFKSQ